MAIEVSAPEHWQGLSRRRLTTVLDPMVVRCGELFLQGARGQADPAAVWDLLTKNVHAIGMFFDALVLEDKIPIFNYGDTFDAQLNVTERLLATINEREPVVYDIDVRYETYTEVKEAAL